VPENAAVAPSTGRLLGPEGYELVRDTPLAGVMP